MGSMDGKVTIVTGASRGIGEAIARRMAGEGAINKNGRIIGVASIAGIAGNTGQTNYAASKAGVIGFVDATASELTDGITANAVAPGEIATPMTGQTDEDPTGTERPGIPLGRPGDAREIAAVVAFLASPQASYVTGASWAVDGGMLQMGPHGGSHISSHEWRTA